MNQIEVKKKGKKTRNNEAFEKIAAIKVGSFIVFKKKDWHMKTQPGSHLLRRRLGREFQVQTLKDDSGWKITAL